MSLKKWVKKIPLPITKNHKYDIEAKKVMKKILQVDSNCIDIGCHEGDFIELFLKYAPNGKHIGIEPLPDYFKKLEKRFPSNCQFFELALSDEEGESSFNYVLSNPAYSGLQKRKYDKPNEQDTSIVVKKDKLDNLLDSAFQVDFIKIDVEGGEYQVLKGAAKTIQKWQPVIIFEHGLGGADIYGTSPEILYELLQSYGLQVGLMEDWLKGKQSFNKAEFCRQFYHSINYYFIAF